MHLAKDESPEQPKDASGIQSGAPGKEAIPEGDKDKIANRAKKRGHGKEVNPKNPTKEGIKEKIDDVLNDPNTEIGRRFNDDGTVAYKGSDGTIVIHNPNDTINKGSVFKPDDPDGYFTENFPND